MKKNVDCRKASKRLDFLQNGFEHLNVGKVILTASARCLSVARVFGTSVGFELELLLSVEQSLSDFDIIVTAEKGLIFVPHPLKNEKTH